MKQVASGKIQVASNKWVSIICRLMLMIMLAFGLFHVADVFANDPIELNVGLTGQGSDKISTEGGARGILSNYIGTIFIFGGGLVVIVAVIMIIIGGFEIMLKGTSEGMSAGKERIMQALLGLVLVFLTALILHTINPNFFTLGNGG